MLKIWGRPTSICTQRVLWACVEAGVAYELRLASGTMGPDGHVSTGVKPYGLVDAPWYRAMNPNSTVPTIDDDGFVLWESNAIVGYIAATYGVGSLCDGSATERALASQWMSWTNEHLEPPLHVLVMELSRLREDLRTPGEIEKAVAAITPALECLDAHLAQRRFVCGERFSIGDIPAGAASYRFKVFAQAGPSTPHIDAWLERLAEREGFRHHVAPPELHI